MRRKTKAVRTARRSRIRCEHRPQHETDWLGRTYIGCPVCNQWKLVKPHAAEPDDRRWAA
jgi:hypothetical protein